jgi:hypothetical protein
MFYKWNATKLQMLRRSIIYFQNLTVAGNRFVASASNIDVVNTCQRPGLRHRSHIRYSILSGSTRSFSRRTGIQFIPAARCLR